MSDCLSAATTSSSSTTAVLLVRTAASTTVTPLTSRMGSSIHVIELYLPFDASLTAHTVERKFALESAADVDVILLRDSSACSVHRIIASSQNTAVSLNE